MALKQNNQSGTITGYTGTTVCSSPVIPYIRWYSYMVLFIEIHLILGIIYNNELAMIKLERWSSFYQVQQSGLKARPECLVYKKP